MERVAKSSGYSEGGAAAAVVAAVADAKAVAKKAKGTNSETDSEKEKGRRDSAVVDSINLPGQTTRAVAVAFDWLRQFGLSGMLRLARGSLTTITRPILHLLLILLRASVCAFSLEGKTCCDIGPSVCSQ